MADIFAPVMKQFFETGFGNVLVFILASALFFALLRKSKILGENIFISAIVSLIAAFLVGFWIPVFTTFSFIRTLPSFFAQSTAILLFLLVGFIAASMFYPNFSEMLMEKFKSRGTLTVFIALALALFVTSGMVSSFWTSQPQPKPGEPKPPNEILLIAAAVIIFVVILVIGSSVALGGKD